MAKFIDQRAIIHPEAEIAEDVVIGPWSYVGPGVSIGEGTFIGSHVVIEKNTTIGLNNKIYSFASLGQDPQHRDYQSSTSTYLKIGDNNVIREYCTINRAFKAEGYTIVGNNNFFMAYTHVAHDCIIANDVTLVNNSSLAGHVSVGNGAILSGFVGVHQFCHIGDYSFISRAAMVAKDVLPFIMVAHNPVSVYGLNKIGLQRKGFSKDTLNNLTKAYSIIFKQSLIISEAIEKLQSLVLICPEVQLLIDGLESSKRGIVR